MSRSRSLALWLAVGALGCSRGEAARPAAKEPALAATTSAPPSPPVAAQPEEKHSPPAQPPASLSSAQWVALIADAENLKRSPEQMASHFATLGPLTRTAIAPDRANLRSEGTNHALDIAYAQAEGQPWQLVGLYLELSPAEGGALDSLYRGTEQALRKKLGKPREEYKPKQKLFKLVGQHLVTLDERSSQGARIVYVELSEAQAGD